MTFVEIPPEILQSIASVSDRMPKLYYHPSWLARKFFWLRLRYLHRFIKRFAAGRRTCLDFGCGTGIFLPTLSNVFTEVTAVDIETVEARQLLEHYDLQNVRLIGEDIYTLELPSRVFEVAVAADVLEHFRDLQPPVARIRQWLRPDGLLFTSLPTENIFTRLTRIIGKYKKPWDHYHTGFEVEGFLESQGFRRVHTSRVIPVFPLYIVSVWKLKQSGVGPPAEQRFTGGAR